jgi:TonB family protein
MMSNVQQASGGVKFGANVVVTLQAVSATDLQASALATVLKAMSSGMAKMGGSVNGIASAASLLQNLNVTAEGKTTTISLSVPESQIEEMIKTARANEPSRESTKQLQTRPAPAPAAPGTGYATLGGPVGVAGAVPQRIHVAREVQKAKLIQHADPVYPPLAVQARISGVVRLNAIIGKDGTVQNLTVASGHPLLVAPAMEAVKQWVYEPTLLNGQAVEVATQVEVNFTLEP